MMRRMKFEIRCKINLFKGIANKRVEVLAIRNSFRRELIKKEREREIERERVCVLRNSWNSKAVINNSG